MVPLSIVVMRNVVKTLTSFIGSGISGMYTISMSNQCSYLTLILLNRDVHMLILHLLAKKKKVFILIFSCIIADTCIHVSYKW